MSWVPMGKDFSSVRLLRAVDKEGDLLLFTFSTRHPELTGIISECLHLAVTYPHVTCVVRTEEIYKASRFSINNIKPK